MQSVQGVVLPAGALVVFQIGLGTYSKKGRSAWIGPGARSQSAPHLLWLHWLERSRRGNGFGRAGWTGGRIFVEVPPLTPVTRSSRLVLPVAIELKAIQDAIERSARDFSGKLAIPSPPGSSAEITWSGERGAFVVTGRPEGLSLSTTLNGTLRATGQFGPPGGPGGLFEGPPGVFFGPPGGGAAFPPGFRSPLAGFFGGGQEYASITRPNGESVRAARRRKW